MIGVVGYIKNYAEHLSLPFYWYILQHLTASISNGNNRRDPSQFRSF